MEEILKEVEQFWNNNLCGEHFISAEYPSREFFEQYREFRYKKEHHLDYIIDWQSAQNKDVLEIGLGVGADATRWAAHARSFVGMDLTWESVSATKLHLSYLGLEENMLRSNAEILPLKANIFDIVYSHGVLHHTPYIERALKEIYRVLRPSGEIMLMLYTKESFNYWIRIQLYLRLRFLIELFIYNLGADISEPWATHIRNFRQKGASYFSWSNFPHKCTDGPDCEIANIYFRSEIIRMLVGAGFKVKRLHKAHLPVLQGCPEVERVMAKYVGFYQFIWAEKV